MAKARFHAHIRPQGAVGDNARRILRARLAELSTWAQYVHDEGRAREQHQLRIATKRLRYTLELFQEFLPEQTGEAIKDLKALQDALGLLHDCDVLIAMLRSALFVPDGATRLTEAIPEAQDLPPALLEVLGQPAPGVLPGVTAARTPQIKAEKAGQRGHHGYKNERAKDRRRGKQGKKQARRQTADMARSRVRPTAEQRAALERFLPAKELQRRQLYQEFVKRWEKLEHRNFRASILHLIEAAEAPGRAHISPLHA